MIAYRIQQPEHSLELLLDPESQFSTSWDDESHIRHGISSCTSIEKLAVYFAQVGIPLSADCLLVTMECELSDEIDGDAHMGAKLVIPTAIVSAEPVPDSFFEMVSDAYDSL